MTSDNDSFEALLNASEKTPVRTLSPGQKTTATIVGVDGETIFLDVGLKSEGRVPLKEFAPAGGTAEIHVGDRIDIFVERYEDRDGSIMLMSVHSGRSGGVTSVQFSPLFRER